MDIVWCFGLLCSCGVFVGSLVGLVFDACCVGLGLFGRCLWVWVIVLGWCLRCW